LSPTLWNDEGSRFVAPQPQCMDEHCPYNYNVMEGGGWLVYQRKPTQYPSEPVLRWIRLSPSSDGPVTIGSPPTFLGTITSPLEGESFDPFVEYGRVIRT
jgi:hypothetical protein